MLTPASLGRFRYLFNSYFTLLSSFFGGGGLGLLGVVPPPFLGDLPGIILQIDLIQSQILNGMK